MTKFFYTFMGIALCFQVALVFSFKMSGQEVPMAMFFLCVPIVIFGWLLDEYSNYDWANHIFYITAKNEIIEVPINGVKSGDLEEGKEYTIQIGEPEYDYTIPAHKFILNSKAAQNYINANGYLSYSSLKNLLPCRFILHPNQYIVFRNNQKQSAIAWFRWNVKSEFRLRWTKTRVRTIKDCPNEILIGEAPK